MARTRRSKWSTNLACLPLEDRCNPGGGTFADGQFNFTVSLQFQATASELTMIQTAFQGASDIINDATDGQHRFGFVTIVQNGGATNEAEFVIYKSNGRPDAQAGQYGTRGAFSRLYLHNNTSKDGYFNRLYGSTGSSDIGDAYTIAHEFGHQAYGILDEYSGPHPMRTTDSKGNILSVNVKNAPTESATLSYSLMDNYLTRGGRSTNPRGAYTLNEFTVRSNHDPNRVTWQTFVNGRSDWEQIVATKYTATMPSNLPTDAAPTSVPVNFITNVVGTPYTMMAVDRSVFTAQNNRLFFLRLGTNAYIQSVPVGEKVGVVAYADGAFTASSLRTINSDDDRLAVMGAINAIDPLLTPPDVEAALSAAASQLVTQTTRSANSIVVLVGTGVNAALPDPRRIIPALNRDNITVLSVLWNPLATNYDEAVFRDIATQTGGIYYRVSDAEPFASANEILDSFKRQRMGSGVLSQAPGQISSGGQLQHVVNIPPGNGPAELAVSVFDPTDDVTVQLQSPSGAVINSSGPGVNALVAGGLLRGYRVADPEPGLWTIIANAGTVNTGALAFSAYQETDPFRINVNAGWKNTNYPEPVTVTVTPLYQGGAVLGATVNGVAIAPDGKQTPMVFFDNGFIENGDAIPGDGIYSAYFNNYGSSGNGTYKFQVNASGTGLFTSGGEGIGEEDELQGDPVPDFSKTGTGTTIVAGVPAQVVANDLNVGVVPQGQQSFVVIVSNQGNSTANDVLSTVFLGGSLNPTSMVPSQGNVSLVDGKLLFQPGAIAPGGSASVTVNVQPRTTSEYRIIADVKSTSQIDPSLFNNKVSLPITLLHSERVTIGSDRGLPGQLMVFDTIGASGAPLQPFGGFTGGVRTAAGDFNGDGIADLVVGTGPGRATNVQVLDGVTQQVLFTVDPFEAAFTGGVFVAAGDMNGDGKAELLISPDEGGGPRVQVYNGADFVKKADFFGIGDPDFRGGARANVGDLNGDGLGDLVVSAGFGGGPRIAAFNGALLQFNGGPKLFGDFFAFEPELRNGAYVAAGDINGDGFAELIAGAGPGGGPRVLALDGEALTQNNGQLMATANFFGGNVDGRGGIRVAVKDLDGDNKADLVVGAGTGAGSRVTAYLGKNITANGTPPAELDFDAFAGFTGGVFVG